MKTAQANTLSCVNAVLAFLDTHAARITHIATCGSRQALEACAVEASRCATAQAIGDLDSRACTLEISRRREELVQGHMVPIVRIARANSCGAVTNASLRLPRSRRGLHRLGVHAYAMARSAACHADTFVEAGLPADFIARLESAADALLEASARSARLKAKTAEATHRLRSALTSALQHAAVLDAFMQSAARDNPELLGGWNQVKRVKPTSPRSLDR